MLKQARVVIIGSGIVGSSIAYHLARLGWREIVVLDQGELVSGTTSHAPGLVGQLRSSAALTRMLMYSVSLYRTLSVDGEAGFMGEASLRVASSKARWAQMQQQAAFAQSVGLEVHLVTAAEAGKLFPLLNLTGLEGALCLPSDGSADAVILARSLQHEAEELGVTFVANSRVQQIDVANSRIRAAVTQNGRIEAETVVVAAGIWSPMIGRLVGLSLPVVPMNHQYVVSTTLPELENRVVPNLRDPDGLVYFRQRGSSLVYGGYERNPVTFEDLIPEDTNPTIRSFDRTRFEPLHRAAVERVPALRSCSNLREVNGLEAFTADGEFLLGPSSDIRGLWVACGFCAHGVSSAGGVGKVMADWMVHGDPGLDVSAMALERFAGHARSDEEVRNGACSVYSTYYDIAP